MKPKPTPKKVANALRNLGPEVHKRRERKQIQKTKPFAARNAAALLARQLVGGCHICGWKGRSVVLKHRVTGKSASANVYSSENSFKKILENCDAYCPNCYSEKFPRPSIAKKALRYVSATPALDALKNGGVSVPDIVEIEGGLLNLESLGDALDEKKD